MQSNISSRPAATAATSLGLPEYRDTIDLIATQRARALRVALFATMLHRPDPSKHQSDDWVSGAFDQQIADMRKSMNLLVGGETFDQVPQAIRPRIEETARNNAENTAIIGRFVETACDLRHAVANSDPGVGKMIDEFIKFGRGPFFASVTEMIEALWVEFEQSRNDDLQRAAQATEAVTNTLARLAHIGKHVRLVSLNASVEAARAGEAGLGLSVIAQEFKSLAEEIQQLASSAQNDINSLR